MGDPPPEHLIFFPWHRRQAIGRFLEPALLSAIPFDVRLNVAQVDLPVRTRSPFAESFTTPPKPAET